jgi:hypothetical protein
MKMRRTPHLTVAVRASGMAIKRFVSNIQAPAIRQAVKLTSSLFPEKSRPCLLVIQQVLGDPTSGRRFDDWFPRHLTSPKICPRMSKRCSYQAHQESRFSRLFMPPIA